MVTLGITMSTSKSSGRIYLPVSESAGVADGFSVLERSPATAADASVRTGSSDGSVII